MKKNYDNNKVLMNVFIELKKKYLRGEIIVDDFGSTTVELIDKKLILNPMQPIIDLGFRKTNLVYVKKEIDWYNSKSLNVKDIEGDIPKIWLQICDKDFKINSNYGWMIYSEENFNQYDNCVNELLKNKFTRKAEMIYQRPSMWKDYCNNNMSDFCCTDGVQLFIRNEELIYIVKQRSSDIIFGFFNDFYWHCVVYNKIYNELKKKKYKDLKIGKIIFNLYSFHIYEKHFNLFNKF